ncbi:MAG TPA: YciI family protein [Chitinophagaceae bacterium]|nr:YciI family protein [Chitinophagaceae bacterium]
MKDFMLIFIGGSDAMNLSPEEMQNHMGKWFGWIDKLKAANKYVAGEALTPGGKTVKGKKPVVTDGPFAEAKEVVGGFFIVKANSIEEASEIAKDCPDLPLNGTVEIREVMKF